MFVYTNRNTPSRSILITCLLAGSFFLSTALAEVKIDHKPVTKATSGQRIDLSAKFKDKSAGISKAFAYFNSDQDSLWHSVPMTGSGKKYSGQLPAPDVHTSAVNYRFLVVNNKDQIQTGEIHTIKIKKDENAVARLKRKPPTDIKVDVSEIQDAKDLSKKIKRERMTQADKDKEAKRSTRPNPDSRVQVLSEYRPDIDTLKGFNDYVNMYYAPKAYGVTAGIVDASASVTGAGAGTYVGPAAAGGGMSGGILLGGAVLAGGAAVAGGISSGDSGGGSGGISVGTGTSGQVTVRDNGPNADDSFQVFVDGQPVGSPTPLGGSSSTTLSGLSSGAHQLSIQFVQGPGAGTYQVTLGQGVTFQGGGTSRSGNIFGNGSSANFTIMVP